MKGEIIEKLEQAKEVTEPVYQKIVDQVYEKYAKVKNVDKSELNAMVSDIRKHWKAMVKQADSKKKSVTKKVEKKVKKVLKK